MCFLLPILTSGCWDFASSTGLGWKWSSGAVGSSISLLLACILFTLHCAFRSVQGWTLFMCIDIAVFFLSVHHNQLVFFPLLSWPWKHQGCLQQSESRTMLQHCPTCTVIFIINKSLEASLAVCWPMEKRALCHLPPIASLLPNFPPLRELRPGGRQGEGYGEEWCRLWHWEWNCPAIP